jgi:anti-anti-sigma factor
MSASAYGSEHQRGAIRVVPETDDIVAVCLKGDFDLTNASALDAQIQQALDRGNDVILDLSEATFIDSSIIRVVVRASRSAVRREQTIVIQLATATIVERALEVVKIEQMLPRAHDRQEAVRMIRQQTETLLRGD